MGVEPYTIIELSSTIDLSKESQEIVAMDEETGDYRAIVEVREEDAETGGRRYVVVLGPPVE